MTAPAVATEAFTCTACGVKGRRAVGEDRTLCVLCLKAATRITTETFHCPGCGLKGRRAIGEQRSLCTLCTKAASAAARGAAVALVPAKKAASVIDTNPDEVAAAIADANLALRELRAWVADARKFL
jgi:hypothetical protein